MGIGIVRFGVTHMFDYIADIIRAADRRIDPVTLAQAQHALQRAHRYTGPVYNRHGRIVRSDAPSPVRSVA